MKPKREIKIGENLQRLMASRKVSVTVTAREVGMNKSTLHGYCNGIVPRNLKQLKALADYLGISFDELIFGAPYDFASVKSEGTIEGRYELTIKRAGGSDENEKR